MAAKAKGKSQKNKETQRSTKQVWRIFRFQERFELPEDIKICRKSALLFTRDFVSVAGGDEAVGYLNQFNLLCDGDGLQNALFKGLYRMLIRMAASHSRAKRGYLLNADGQPLTDSQIGKILNIKTAEIRKYLKKYSSVKLLEKVDLPDFDLTKNDDLNNNNQPDGDNDKSASEPKKRGRGRPPKKSPENSGKKQKALNKSKKENRIEKRINNKKEIEFELEEQAQDQSRNESQALENDTVNDRGIEAEPPTSPASTPSTGPNSSTKTDEPGQDDKRMKAPSRSLDKPKEHIGRTIDIMQYRYDKASNEFAIEIMYQLGIITAIDLQRFQDDTLQLTRDQAKERGNWSAAWYEAAREFSSDTMAELKNQLLKRLHRAKGKANPPAFIRTCWGNLCNDYRRKKHKPRASPAM